MLRKLLRKKPVAYSEANSLLQSSLTGVDLTLMGIGAIIGAGVFILTGIAAATKAGPAVVLSYMVAGLAAAFAALAYAELAASIGGTGSAYSYAYAGFGEFIAWMIGWDLLLEYAMSVSTVAIGWAGYVNNFLTAIHLNFPDSLTKSPLEGGTINALAVAIILMLSLLLCLGVKYGARFNAIVVFIKLITIGVFVVVAAGHIDIQNWQNFFPFGWQGVMEGAGLVFFAYIGFDALSTTVEETIQPQRNVPIGILASLFICTLIYIVVSALLTGIAHYTTLNVRSPVAEALLRLGYDTAAGLVAAGAVAGLTTVILVMYYGLTRICLAIARDGLFPIFFAKINLRTHTPIHTIFISGIITALVAGFVPITRAAELVNIGTLAAFTVVSIGAIVLRHTHPDIPRPFKLPFSPFIPILGVIFCVYLMIQLPVLTWVRFTLWALCGVIIYFCYGLNHSLLNKKISKK